MTTTLITGASSGLGAEMARQLAARGHDLALCARRTDRLEELRTEITAAHPDRRVEVAALDVTDPDAVRACFRDFDDRFTTTGGVERVVVNAGLGKGAPLGTGGDAANRETATTNVLGALAQVESAVELFRAAGRGHLVVVSSIAALRGLPRTVTTYAASKAFVAHLVEGLRTELGDGRAGRGVPGIDLTVLYPGYIVSEMNDVEASSSPLMSSTEKGVRSMVAAIEKRVASACVPPLPWAPLSLVLRHAPQPLLRRMV
ncbi:SDR family oxidoreductase [Nocardioides sp. AX2bis]|uniref:SDR family oxidoreductase n=1 Tax=Nocardioides sp. AX2bis TaxID=2653157 RepID=UPI0012F46C89|nr:SDR family oxidoreductase [Nocardioides sp. AX2bis]VXB94544.1 Short-chain dehydrogenase [Nocardioides sp. AX2bis]